jgi:pyruvate/2-oxoacid:ferredoxin oxidoreductase alpha subunit
MSFILFSAKSFNKIYSFNLLESRRLYPWPVTKTEAKTVKIAIKVYIGFKGDPLGQCTWDRN